MRGRRKAGQWEQKWRDLMDDDYINAERKTADGEYWKRRIKDELERRRIKESGSWWEKFWWDFKQGGS